MTKSEIGQAKEEQNDNNYGSIGGASLTPEEDSTLFVAFLAYPLKLQNYHILVIGKTVSEQQSFFLTSSSQFVKTVTSERHIT